MKNYGEVVFHFIEISINRKVRFALRALPAVTRLTVYPCAQYRHNSILLELGAASIYYIKRQVCSQQPSIEIC